MGSRTAFFYGTLMFPAVLYNKCQRNKNGTNDAGGMLMITPATLLDYSRRVVLHATYPGMIPQKGSRVEGTYVTGLTDTDIANLDDFEGDQYEKEKVMLLVNGHEIKEAETYIYRDGLKDWLAEEEWDLEEFKKNHLRLWGGEGYDEDGGPPETSNEIPENERIVEILDGDDQEVKEELNKSAV